MNRRKNTLLVLCFLFIVVLLIVGYRSMSPNETDENVAKQVDNVKKQQEKEVGTKITPAPKVDIQAQNINRHQSNKESIEDLEDLPLVSHFSGETSSPVWNERMTWNPDAGLLTDSNPKLTHEIVSKLKNNYKNVQDLQYTVELEYEKEFEKNNAVRHISVKFPEYKEDDIEEYPTNGKSKLFKGKLRIDTDYSTGEKSRDILTNGTMVSTMKVFGFKTTEITEQAKILGRYELFDSIFFHNYVTNPSESETESVQNETYEIATRRGILTVDKNSLKPIKVSSYYPNGKLHQVQEFLELYDFPNLSFSFPKTIKTTFYVDPRSPEGLKQTCISHVKDLKINQELDDNIFTQ